MDEKRAQELKAIWNAYLDDLRRSADELFRATSPGDEVTAAEGLRHLARATRMSLGSQIEVPDPEIPTIMRYVDEVSKFGCDNPDTIYMGARIDGARTYRVFGRRNTVDYLSFMVNKPDENGKPMLAGFIDSKGITVEPDGTFEIIASAVKPANAKNWLPLDRTSGNIGIRQTFLDRRKEVPADLHIELIDQNKDAKPAPLTVAQMKERLAAASQHTFYIAKTFTDWTESYIPAVNTLPRTDQLRYIQAGLDPNIYFYRSFWSLNPDEALVVHIPRIPECDTWNFQLDNYWQESMDYRFFKSHVNKHTAKYNKDGSCTIVVAHKDPGHPNWLNTADHVCGHVGMRWIRASEHVDPIMRLCKFNEIKNVVAELEKR